MASDAGTTTTGHATRARLVEATTEVLQEGGYAAASVAAIAERAGVANGTLYRHFPSKAELFVEVFRSVCGREISAMEKAAAHGDSATRQLDAVVATFATRALRNPRLAWALVAEPVDPLVDVERLAYRRKYCEQIARGLATGIASGEFRQLDTELTAAALVGAIGDALIGPLSPAAVTAADPGVVVRELQSFCRHAVGAAAA